MRFRAIRYRFDRVVTVLLATGMAWPLAAEERKPAAGRGPAATEQMQQRQIPSAGDHPGNVFLQGDVVAVPVPADLRRAATAWRATDDRRREVARGKVRGRAAEPVRAGTLGVGWYRIEFLDSAGGPIGWTTAAVLARLAAPVPDDSPVCVDSATAWFARDDPAKQEQLSRLAALSGVNWIRDRIRWREVQPAPDRFVHDTTYDSSAEIQARYGLKVLQVFHDTPPWAVTGGGGAQRFPGDLRAVYRFGRAMSGRFQGKVQAWEPWNEANVRNFGGHTIDEICSYQKAAYLGFKAGDPAVTVCWNVTTGVPTRRHTRGVIENETWPYFDTYNIHTYDWPNAYQRLWGPVREAACGKPIWVTESDRGIAAEADSPTRDLSPRNERLKAQFMAQSYASSLWAGARRHFHFILGQYGEKQIQFGLLRHDLTPRPSYVALAAVGRFLAGARCLGRYVLDEQPNVHVIAFHSYPDGRSREVLVAWAERDVDWPQRGRFEADWPLPNTIVVEKCFDYLGRPVAGRMPKKLTPAPTFIILPPGQCAPLTLQSFAPSLLRTGTAPTVVLQCLLPKETTIRSKSGRWVWEYEHQIEPDKEIEIPLFVYNFASADVSGSVSVEQSTAACHITPDQWDVHLASMGRQRLAARLRVSAASATEATSNARIKLRGEFGAAGRPVLAFQLRAAPPAADCGKTTKHAPAGGNHAQ